MGSNYVLPLSAPQADLETVGGKGMSLAKLAHAGLPVPGGFHVTTGAYLRFIAANELQPAIDSALQGVDLSRPAALEAASEAIRALFAQGRIPEEIAGAITAAYLTLPDPRGERRAAVAVRSSATAEDLPEASFAGQQETYLNVRGAEEVLEATRNCWASLWTARAIAYRARQGILSEGVALAVVVQAMVDAEAAGILFTANPLDGRREEVVINAAWGLGEAVVGGAVTPDTITVAKTTGEVIARETAEKLVMTVRTATGTEERPVPEALQRAPALSDEQAAQLARCGAQIEELYGMPMDLEWALADGEFSILQARPVTALPEAPIEWAPPDPRGIYMRGSVVDLLPDPLSPLFISWALPALREQMKPLGKRLTGIEPNLHEDYFTTIHGFAYMNARIPPRAWPWILFGLLPSYPRMLRNLAPLWRDELHPEFQAFIETTVDRVPGEMSDTALLSESGRILDATMYYVCALMFATMGASAGSEMLLTRVYEKFAGREGDPPASVLLMGWDNIPIQAEKSLYDLAAWCRERPVLAECVLKTGSDELSTRLQSGKPPAGIAAGDWQGLRRRFRRHLERFGHIIFQLDFAADLPLDHPEPMLENIKMYLRGEGANPHTRQQANAAKRIRTGEAILARLKGFRRWAFRTALKAGQSMAAVREDALADIGLGYPGLRAILFELGRRFALRGTIQAAGDVFWLEKEEIDALVAGEELALQGRVAARKAHWDRLKRETPPPMIPMKERVMGVKTDFFVAHSAEAQAGTVLRGVPASAGVVRAPARVLHGPEDFDAMRPGEVLVAGATTPAWTPLFAMASAVVTDIGGPLSHGSIVAREYGLPAVMGTGVATRRIRSGQTITVDGSRGEVILESGEAGQTERPSPPTEWPRPDPKSTYARGSLAEHLPNPVSPLFATLGLEIANRETDRMWEMVIGREDTTLIQNGFYHTVNGYVFGGFRMSGKDFWAIMKVMVSQMRAMLTASTERWQAARQVFADVVTAWNKKAVEALSPNELLQGINEVFSAAAKYYTVIQGSTLPSASTSEVLFVPYYTKLIKRRNDPEATVFLLGFETMPIRAEKALFDIAMWVEGAGLREYVLQTPTERLLSDFEAGARPVSLPPGLWEEWGQRFQHHLDEYGHTVYDFDFINPTPAEDPGPLLEAIKVYLEGKAVNPHERHQEAAEKREQATRSVLERIGWPRVVWFRKLLEWAQEVGPTREDSIFDMGMGHALIRRMLNELGRRLLAGGAIEAANDIYWLEKDEAIELAATLERGESLLDMSGRIPPRKAKWQAALGATPPVMLPEKTRWSKVIGGGEAREENGRIILKGLGTSGGQATAPACVLHGPEDFPKMRPGDVLVATTTTPAWTPLFAMASAIVTDIGGPLSHSSIVAREYGIPAVMAARNATRHIKSGQTVTVDGGEGTVTLENPGRQRART